VQGSLEPGALPGPIRDRLAGFAAANWPSPWREALALALRDGTVFGTPIVHYEPRWLARGRAALAGDAAHAASPMVGGGFRQGLYDVEALSRTAAAITSPAQVPDALRRYAGLRLGPAARHVAVSERATASYLAHAAEWPT
jgi:2-polyprenyl-6-methoxyphenol hydroxylase-like FAD-dependent oxidoreductase